MENTGWIKMYRKAQENKIWHDKNAWRVFQWILWNVDYKTGKNTFRRKQISEGTGMNESTVYKVTARLHATYKVLNIKTNNKFTEISVLNWAKYQGEFEEFEKVTGHVNANEQQSNNKSNNKFTEISLPISAKYQGDLEKVTGRVNATGEQSNNKSNNAYYIKEYIKEERRKNNINNILADEQQAISSNGKKETKVYQRKSVEKQSKLERICYFLEDTLTTKIVLWPKQAKALNLMEKAGYTEKQILFTIKYMAKNEWYEDKGFDLMTVANNIDKVKASARKVVNSHGISRQTYEI